jgi:hypothetical protein
MNGVVLLTHPKTPQGIQTLRECAGQGIDC